MAKALVGFLIILIGFVNLHAQNLYNDILDKEIKSVQFYLTGGKGEQIDFPIKPLDGSNPLRLEFDWLGEELPYMMARIVHCNYNWEKSVLNDVEFLQDYNEFQLNDFEQSSNTFVPFFHVTYDVPNPKISGNYVLQIYNEDDPDKIYITRRFVIFENRLNVGARVNYSNVVSERRFNHQIDLKIFHNDYEIRDPQSSVNVTILQNGRWDNAITELQPTAIASHNSSLIYDYFDGSNNFVAGNEWRQFDTRSIKTGGMGVKDVNRDITPREFTLYTDEPLKGLAYTYRADIDGRFVIQNFRGDDDLNSDYAKVYFELKMPESKKPVYIFGQISDWKLDHEFVMKYDEQTQSYKKELLLKQGHYNYLYAVRKKGKADTAAIDGSHNQTRNTYIILVYHRPFGVYYDKVVGYSVIE